MAKPVLVLMAAGLGSRYGGLKQIDPMDDKGQLLIDFSVYDALKAGFEDVIFIIKKDMEQDFMEAIGSRMQSRANVICAFQELDKLPDGITLPKERTKPLGTTHALLCARDAIGDRPFAAINADDYYGPATFRLMYDYLSAPGPENQHYIVSYLLENTLSDIGPVSRGVCHIEDGFLRHVVERKRITRCDGGGCFTDAEGNSGFIPAGTPVSMNCWAFRPGIMPMLEKEFACNLRNALEDSPLTFEDILPTTVQSLMAKGLITVKADNSQDRWFGVTYREDRPEVMAEIAKLKAKGMYPDSLWN